MKIGKRQGGSGIGPYFWEKDGDVVDVPTEMGLELLALKGADHFLVDETNDVEPDNSRPAEIHAVTINEVRQGLGMDPKVDPLLRATQDIPAARGSLPPTRGSVAAMLEWVGSDKLRAEQAMRAERDHRGEVRPSLEVELRRIIES